MSYSYAAHKGSPATKQLLLAVSMDDPDVISTPDEAIELLQVIYQRRDACRQLKTLATEKVRQARLEEEIAERKLYEAEGCASKIVDLIKEKGFQLSSIAPGFFLLINGKTHSIIAAGNSSVNITLD